MTAYRPGSSLGASAADFCANVPEAQTTTVNKYLLTFRNTSLGPSREIVA